MQNRNHLDGKSAFWLKGTHRMEGWLSSLAHILVRPLNIQKRKWSLSPLQLSKRHTCVCVWLVTENLSLSITWILGDALPCIERGWTEGRRTHLLSPMVCSRSLAGMGITYVLNACYVGQPHNRQGSPLPPRVLSPQPSTSARPAESWLPGLCCIDLVSF